MMMKCVKGRSLWSSGEQSGVIVERKEASIRPNINERGQAQ
jgi:hypothetical protein